MAKDMKIGFIGTGIMGFQMARNLAQAGHSLAAWNRTRDKCARLAAFGVEIAEAPAAAVAGRGVAICMLSNGPVCDEVLFGVGSEAPGAVAAMAMESTLIVMSSIPVDTARAQWERAGQRGLRYIDAPVSGGERGATEATLTIMAGGEPDAVAAAEEILKALGRVTRIGDAGAGSLAKLANQVIVANTLATVAEALLLAKAGGADPAAVREALLGGFADSTILRQHGERMIKGDWAPGGPIKYQVKDQRAATALAESLNLELPVTNLVRRLYEDMMERGDGDLDHSAIYLELARRNGLT